MPSQPNKQTSQNLRQYTHKDRPLATWGTRERAGVRAEVRAGVRAGGGVELELE